MYLQDFDSETPRRPATPLLDTVNYPVHIKNFNRRQLKQLAQEIRQDVIHTVSHTGGHLGASLGVTDLTVALHYVFNTPEDKIIFDVGHQVMLTTWMLALEEAGAIQSSAPGGTCRLGTVSASRLRPPDELSPCSLGEWALLWQAAACQGLPHYASKMGWLKD